MKQKMQVKQIPFPEELLIRSESRVKSLGVGFPEYVRHLVINDLEKQFPTDIPSFIPTTREKRIIEDSMKLTDKDFIKVNPEDIMSL